MSVNVKTQVNWKEILERTQKTGYNLYDLVPVDFSEIEKLEEEVVEAEVVDEENIFIDIRNKIQTLKTIVKDNEEKYQFYDSNIDSYIEKHRKLFNQVRENYFKENLNLPREALTSLGYNFEEQEDVLTKAAVAPRAKLKDIKKIADALGFMIMPWEYHNKRSFENEPYELKESIYEFEKLNKFCDLYVVSPINFWDTKAHISAEDPNKPFFVSEKIKNVVASVEIQLPILREIYLKIKNHDDRISALESDLDKAFSSINDLQIKFEKIQKEISAIWTKIAEQDKKIKEAQSIARAALAVAEEAKEMAMRPIDPMLIAVKKGSELNDIENAIIGPVWGPDFSWMIPAVENLVPQIGQRELLEELKIF